MSTYPRQSLFNNFFMWSEGMIIAIIRPSSNWYRRASSHVNYHYHDHPKNWSSPSSDHHQMVPEASSKFLTDDLKFEMLDWQIMGRGEQKQKRDSLDSEQWQGWVQFLLSKSLLRLCSVGFVVGVGASSSDSQGSAKAATHPGRPLANHWCRCVVCRCWSPVFSATNEQCSEAT